MVLPIFALSEMSHRGADFSDIMNSTETNLRDLM